MTAFSNHGESLVFIKWLKFIFTVWILKALALSLIYKKVQTPTYSVKISSSRFSTFFFLMYEIVFYFCKTLQNH